MMATIQLRNGKGLPACRQRQKPEGKIGPEKQKGGGLDRLREEGHGRRRFPACWFGQLEAR